jgi:hypothetical protein
MTQKALGRALLYGIAAGMRTSAPLVACAKAQRAWEWYALLGEFAIDKLPWTPDRTALGGYCGRIATAGYGAYRDTEESPNAAIEQGLIAGASAFVATRIMFEVRRFLTKPGRLPDMLVALGEDALVLACIVHLGDRVENSDAD